MKLLLRVLTPNPIKLILFFLLAISFFARIYRTDQLLRFYYDQGRDALVIHEMITTPKPVLVGPTTGLAGILRGPAYYYLILPAYLIGQGSPIVAAIWLQILNTIGLILIFLIGKKIFSPAAGLTAVFLVGLSRQFIDLSRWLSEPSLVLVSVPIMLYGLLQIREKNKPQLYWPIIALMAGLNLHFEIASALWFLPALLLLILIFPRYRPSFKTSLISVGVFFATLIPQIAFDLRHGGIMRSAIINHFVAVSEPSFAFDPTLIKQRLLFYLDTFNALFTPQDQRFSLLILISFLPLLLIKEFRKRLEFLLPLFLVPLFILAFYQGNQGNFYSYYLIPLFPLWALLVSGALAFYLRHKILFALPLIFFIVFIRPNFINDYHFLTDGIDGPENVTLGNQLAAIDWIYQDAVDQPFNVDVYVPPVIPYAYDYLFLWYGPKKYSREPNKELVSLLYTLNEVDPQHPDLLQKWFARQAGIGKIEKEAAFGGVRVQRRTRI